MSDEHRPDTFESLEAPLQAAATALLAVPIPEDAIERVKMRARKLAAITVSPAVAARPNKSVGRLRSSVVVGLSVAVALLLMIGIGFMVVNYSSGPAFAQVIDKVKAASSVRFTTAMQLGRQVEMNSVVYLEGNRARLEQFDGAVILVEDFDRKKALILNVPQKLAQQADIDEKFSQSFANPIDHFRHAKSNDAESIGQEIFKGRRTDVYRLHKVDLLFIKGDAEMLVWVDVESQLPVKIVVRETDPKSRTEVRFENFVWNEPLDASRFSLAIPDGFQTGTVMMIPPPQKPTQANVEIADNPRYPADGILSRDRVPARIVWDPRGKTITALMRDPESVPPLEQRENELRQWDVTTGKLRWSANIRGASEMAETVDGTMLATVVGYEIQMRDAASGKVMRKWATDESLSPVAFSPDGKTLAAGITEWGRHGGDGGRERGGSQIWDVERASLIRSILDDKPTTFIRWSIDGKYLTTSSNDGPVKLWETATGQLSRISPGRANADFSPDGKFILCVSMTPREEKNIGKVDLYSLQDGSLVRSFASEKGAAPSWLLCVKFSPKGNLIAASDWNGTVTLWDVATGERKQTFTDQKGGVLSIAFSPDGATLAIGSEDRTLRLRKILTELNQSVPER